MQIGKYGKYWAVYDDSGNLICIAVYKKGAIEIIKRFSNKETKTQIQSHIDIQELTTLKKEFSQLNKKFNFIFQGIYKNQSDKTDFMKITTTG